MSCRLSVVSCQLQVVKSGEWRVERGQSGREKSGQRTEERGPKMALTEQLTHNNLNTHISNLNTNQWREDSLDVKKVDRGWRTEGRTEQLTQNKFSPVLRGPTH